MPDVIKFEAKNNQPTMFGATEPVSWNAVVIEGRQIPRMKVREADNGTVEVKFDERWVYIFDSEADARHAATFAAQALAVGSGFPSLSAPSKDRPFAPEVIVLD